MLFCVYLLVLCLQPDSMSVCISIISKKRKKSLNLFSFFILVIVLLFQYISVLQCFDQCVQMVGIKWIWYFETKSIFIFLLFLCSYCFYEILNCFYAFFKSFFFELDVGWLFFVYVWIDIHDCVCECVHMFKSSVKLWMKYFFLFSLFSRLVCGSFFTSPSFEIFYLKVKMGFLFDSLLLSLTPVCFTFFYGTRHFFFSFHCFFCFQPKCFYLMLFLLVFFTYMNSRVTVLPIQQQTSSHMSCL